MLIQVLLISIHGLGKVMGIDKEILSMTVLSLGTNVPDMLSIGIVANKGYPNMAFSVAVAGQIWNIYFGIGAPNLLATAIGTKINLMLNNPNSLIFLAISLVLICLMMAVTKFKLNKISGGFFFFGYIVFVTLLLLKILEKGED